MLAGATSLSDVEEAEIKSRIRAQEKYVVHAEVFAEIDAFYQSDKKVGLPGSHEELASYNECNREIDAAKKAALKAKNPSDNDASPAITFAFNSTSATRATGKPLAPYSAPLVQSNGRDFDLNPIGTDTLKKPKKKGGCCLLM